MKTALKSWAAACALVLAGSAGAVGVPGQGTWETTLQPRNLTGEADSDAEAFYDTALNITWLRNGSASGQMNWEAANAWAANLVVGTNSDWRLPTMIDTDLLGCDHSLAGGTDCGANVQTKTGATVYSEMAHLFSVTLGNKSYWAPVTGLGPQAGWDLTNTGDFQALQDIQPQWSALEYALDTNTAWYYHFGSGAQIGGGDKRALLYALAVHPGDVTTAVPEPEVAALMLIGLGALVAAARRRRPRT